MLPKTIFCDSSESFFVKNSIEFEKNKSLADQGYGLNTERTVPEEQRRKRQARTQYGNFFNQKRTTDLSKDDQPVIENFEFKNPGRTKSGGIADLQKDLKSSYSHKKSARTNFDVINQTHRLSDVSFRAQMHTRGPSNPELKATEPKQTTDQKLM